MKRHLLILLQLFAALTSLAQTPQQIKAGGDFLWAEGRGKNPSGADASATAALADKLAATDILHATSFESRAVWSTYASDIRERSLLTYEADGTALRYIAWKDVTQLFSRRWRKVRELAQSAGKAMQEGKTDIARTYCYWADTYLLTLPPGEEALRADISRMKKESGDGSVTALRIRNVESEVRAIRHALSLDAPKAAAVKPAPAPAAVKENNSAPVRPTIATLPPPESEISLPSGLQQEEAYLPMVFRTQQSLAPMPAEPIPANYKLLATIDIGNAAAFGCRLIWQPGRFGLCMSARSSFSNKVTDYICRSDGTSDFGFIWTSGTAKGSRTAFSGDIICRAFKFLSIYAGAGYADDALYWEDSEARWALVDDLSVKGLLTEAGVVVNLGRLNIGSGISLTSFSRPSIVIDAGISF